jgi:hypothetical protein
MKNQSSIFAPKCSTFGGAFFQYQANSIGEPHSGHLGHHLKQKIE